MALFFNSHRAKLDKKGRVSFPAEFRAALEEDIGDPTHKDYRAFYLRPHHLYDCCEGLSPKKLHSLAERLNQLDDYSEEAERLRETLFGDTARIVYDAEGRFSMPQNLIADAKIGESLVFTARGDTFHVWDEQAFEQRRAGQRQQGRTDRLTVPGERRAP
ncbi:MAG TPA: hypothetical protein VGM87_03180 [Roseomonas sp.]|jgi:MraZ protein